MTVDTIGFVCPEQKEDVFDIVDRTRVAIANLSSRVGKPVKVQDVRIHQNGYVTIDFHIGPFHPLTHTNRTGTEFRSLSIHFDCDNSYVEVDPCHKVIFTVSDWGYSRDIIPAILTEMLDLGSCFYCSTDSDMDFVPFNLTYLTS